MDRFPNSDVRIRRAFGKYALANLVDVRVHLPTSGQGLVYNATDGAWENGTPTTGVTSVTGTAPIVSSNGTTPIISLSIGSDLTVTGGNLVTNLALGGLIDTTITSPTNNQVLTYDAGTSKWKNATPTGGGTTALAGLTTDVSITSPTNKQFLQYYAAYNTWYNVSGIDAGASNIQTTGDVYGGTVHASGEVDTPILKIETAPTANSTGTVAIVAKDINLLTTNAGWLVFKRSDNTPVYVPYWL